jgi:hypothetical protein
MSLAGVTGSHNTNGAKLLSVSNNGTEKFAIDKDGLITTASVNSASIVNGSITSSDIVSEEAWHEVGAGGEPAFQNGWTNWGGTLSTAAFYKDFFGRVHLKGVVTNPGGSAIIFTLPVGYRPAKEENFAQWGHDGTTERATGIRVVGDGNVIPRTSGASNFLPLSGISFRAQ